MFKVFKRSLSISNIEANNATRYLVIEKLRDALSSDIVTVNLQETKHDFHKEYSVELIVATHDDFFRAVKAYADRSLSGIPIFVEDLEKIL